MAYRRRRSFRTRFNRGRRSFRRTFSRFRGRSRRRNMQRRMPAIGFRM